MSYEGTETRESPANVGEPTPWRVEPLIVCRCRACGGLTWTVNEIQKRNPGVNGYPINAKGIGKINEITGHEFAFPPKNPVGDWGRGGTEWLPEGTDRRKWLPNVGKLDYSAHLPNTSEDALGVYPINPKGPGLLTAKWGVPRFPGICA